MPRILQAGTSIGSNAEETQVGQSRAAFIAKMSIALKEARETHIRPRIPDASEVVPARKLAPFLKETDEI